MKTNVIFGQTESDNAETPPAGESIALPPPPPATPPPSTGEDPNTKLDEDLEKKRQERQKWDKSMALPQTQEQRMAKKLAAENTKPRPYIFHQSLNFLYPMIFTSGPRKNYSVEPTVHTNLIWRLTTSKSIAELNWWVGGRVASFSGAGNFQGVAGRYGFIYFGPIVAVGTLAPPPEDDAAKSAESEEAVPKIKSRGGHLLNLGLSVQSRSGKTFNVEPEGDLDTSPVAFDIPGLSMEYSYTRLYFGALSINYVIGAQLGEGKTFAWLGIGAGAWY